MSPFEMEQGPRHGVINMGERWFVIRRGDTDHLVCEAAGETTARTIARALDAEADTRRRRLRDPLIDRAAS